MESEYIMTKQMKEKISNRLVLNFGVLLAFALVLLYVRSALSSTIRGITYTIILVIGILCIIGSIVMFILGKKNGNERLKNNSAIPFGTFIGCVALYLAKLNLIPGYTWNKAILTVYILMAVYFIVMAIITAVLLKKPTVKETDKKIVHKKKRK